MGALIFIILIPILFIYGWGITEVAIQMFSEPPGDGIVYTSSPIYDIFQESFAKQDRKVRPATTPPPRRKPEPAYEPDLMTTQKKRLDVPESEPDIDTSDVSAETRKEWVESYRRRKEFNKKKYMTPKDEQG
jgi:hypothetical protein